MRRPFVLVMIAFFAAGLIAGCATATAPGLSRGKEEPDVESGVGLAEGELTEPSSPPVSSDPEALKRAQGWLDSAVLPPGAVRSDRSVGGFSSYTGWPCSPMVELEAFWTVDNITVSEAALWFVENPPAELVPTVSGPFRDDPNQVSIIVGYTPSDLSLQGLVYTADKAGDGIVIRAEIAAFTADSECPAPPGGGQWGLPGQG